MKRLLAIVAILAGFTFVVGLALHRHFLEPRYGGKTLDQWLNANDPHALTAVRAMGSRAPDWMLVWAVPGGDPFRETRALWNRFAPAKMKWPPPLDPRGKAERLARRFPDEMKPAIPELVRRARNADWNAVHLIQILARDDEGVWIEILKSPDDMASAWAVEHFRNLPSRSDAFRKGVDDAYLPNREPILGSEMLLWRVNLGASGPEILREIQRHLAGDPYGEQAFCAASAAATLGGRGRPILVDGMLSKSRTTRHACTAAFRFKEIAEHGSRVSLPFRDTLIRWAEGLDVELSRQDAALVLLEDPDAVIRGRGWQLLVDSVNNRLSEGRKPAIGSLRTVRVLEALSQGNDAAVSKPATELLRRVAIAEVSTNSVANRAP